MPVFDKYDSALESVQRQCDDCQAKLLETKQRAKKYERRLEAAERREAVQAEALRTLVQMYDRNDPMGIETAMAKIRAMLAD